jgi:hypothetical protein
LDSKKVATIILQIITNEKTPPSDEACDLTRGRIEKNKTTLIKKIKHSMNRYETPETILIDVVSEGVLCGSPTSSGTNESWGYEEI